MKTLKDVDIAGKRVFVRVDFNVPLDADGRITDDARIRAVLPTFDYLLKHDARLIVASHLGRPKGRVAPEFSLAPVAVCLEGLTGRRVTMARDCIGAEIERAVAALPAGELLLLENLRFHPEEERNDDDFARALAGLCDVYVNDAFAVSHRENASVAAIVRHAPLSAAGLLLQRELDYFARAMTTPQRPLVAVVGGAKVSGKLDALKNMLQHVDKIIVGGAMANTFLKSLGHDMGASKVEAEMLPVAAEIMAQAAGRGIKFYLPVDAVAAERFEPGAATRMVPVQEVPPGWMVLDVGPASTRLFTEALYDARTIVWNGPLGVFEMDAFSRGTMAMVAAVAQSHALSIVGGGDTDAAVHKAGLGAEISYISTGGGAFLALMEGRTLPAVAALQGAA